MKYQCPVCGKVVQDELPVFISHTEEHVVDIIKDKHPEWIEKNGLCHKCFDYYKGQLKGE